MIGPRKRHKSRENHTDREIEKDADEQDLEM
jgi:hypothetical protein